MVFIFSRHARKYSSTLKNLCLEGIPAVIRHDAWPLLIENSLNVSLIHHMNYPLRLLFYKTYID